MSGQPQALSTRTGGPTHPITRPPRTLSGLDAKPFEVGPKPVGSLRTFDTRPPGDASAPGSVSRPDGVPLSRSEDVRYARPTSSAVRPASYAHTRPPIVVSYRGYYTRWYCHPWYRHRYATWAVVSFGFAVYPWYDWWVPPGRLGWVWMPGWWSYGSYWPGYWSPIGPAPIGYVYVPGWWENASYVEGYYRAEARPDWEWEEGYYLDDGTFVRGTWRPTGEGPQGYTWEPGFWDGEQYIDGFWRPEFRTGYYWASAFYDEEGVFHAGYWVPDEERPGEIWIPGWFDGNEWIPGYWVPEDQVDEGGLDGWQPPEGSRDGWDGARDPREYVPGKDGETPEARIVREQVEATGEAPLAVPVAQPPAP